MPNSIDDVEFDSYQLQEFLAENIEEDFIILLKDTTRESEENGGNEYFSKLECLRLPLDLILLIDLILHYHLFIILFLVMNQN